MLARFGYAEVIGCRRCALGRTLPESAVCEAEYGADERLAAGMVADEAVFCRYAESRVRLARRFVRAGRWLDVGCSVGYLVEEAARQGFDALGIDTDRSAVEAGNAAGRNVAGCQVDDAAGTFAVVTLSHVLEHQPDPETFLAAVYEKLNPGGYLFLWTPDHRGLLPRAAPSLWYGWQPRQHYLHFSARSLRRLVEGSGFEVVGVRSGSMNHAFRRQPRWQDTAKYALCYALAKCGAAIRMGDEVVLVARRPEAAP